MVCSRRSVSISCFGSCLGARVGARSVGVYSNHGNDQSMFTDGDPVSFFCMSLGTGV